MNIGKIRQVLLYQIKYWTFILLQYTIYCWIGKNYFLDTIDLIIGFHHVSCILDRIANTN